MTWVWAHNDWPRFQWDAQALQSLEAQFLKGSGRMIGAWQHLNPEDQTDLRIDWLSSEAMDTSAIEGEFLNRASVQSSVRRQFGLQSDRIKSGPAEAGVAEMMVAVYQNYGAPLSAELMHNWHAMLMNGRRDVKIAHWRSHAEAMQVVSGVLHAPTIHYEAPASDTMPQEMAKFFDWYGASTDLPILTRAGIAHFYFVCIHPYEDGNGRIGRAVAEKALAQSLEGPSLVALSQMIARKRKGYYDALEAANKSLDITDWLIWFAQTTNEALIYSEHKLTRLIDKTKMFDRLRGQINARQEKILLRLFRAEPDGFEGGLSAANYRQITGALGATATRDLTDLVTKGALRKTGELRYTRYYLNLPPL